MDNNTVNKDEIRKEQWRLSQQKRRKRKKELTRGLKTPGQELEKTQRHVSLLKARHDKWKGKEKDRRTNINQTLQDVKTAYASIKLKNDKNERNGTVYLNLDEVRKDARFNKVLQHIFTFG